MLARRHDDAENVKQGVVWFRVRAADRTLCSTFAVGRASESARHNALRGGAAAAKGGVHFSRLFWKFSFRKRRVTPARRQ